MSSRSPLLKTASLGLALLAGCTSQTATAVTLPSFDDVSASPEAIQNAAQAVVLIEIPNATATGSFISPKGLLLTNNHVLGVDVCPVEGCYAQITSNYQRGSPREQPVTIYVVPKTVDVGLDVAILQAYAGPGGPLLDTPRYLTFDSHDPASLLGSHVHVVGHPEGGLKKWSEGEVVYSDGSWIWTTAFILPGSSGSPILDDHGHIVGLIHRAPASQDLFANDGVNEYSIGTASSALIGAMSAPLPPAMRSIKASVTDADVVRRQLIYLAARASTANVGGSAKSVLTSLGEACDQGLARRDYASPEDLSNGLEPCFDAETWIECRSGEAAAFAVCPSPADINVWRARFDAVYQYWRNFNGQLDLDEVSFAPASLSASKADGLDWGSQLLSQALAYAKPPLDFHVTMHLAAFGISDYEGQSVTDFVKGYAHVPDYAFSGETIAETVLFLNQNGAITSSDTTNLMSALAADNTMDLGTKLYVQEVEYNSGLLP